MAPKFKKRKFFVAKLLDLHRYLKAWSFFLSFKHSHVKWIILVENLALSEIYNVSSSIKNSYNNAINLKFLYGSSIFFKILNCSYFLNFSYSNASFIVSKDFFTLPTVSVPVDKSFLMLGIIVNNRLSLDTSFDVPSTPHNFFFELLHYLHQKEN